MRVNDKEPKVVQKIKLALRERTLMYGKPYCPCSLQRTEDTVCPCKEFREDKNMQRCHCGLYIRGDMSNE